MITLYKKENDTDSEWIEQRLKMMTVAFRVQISDDKKTPAIEESSTFITGCKEIELWLNELEKELKFQRSLSGDACYINPDTGKVC